MLQVETLDDICDLEHPDIFKDHPEFDCDKYIDDMKDLVAYYVAVFFKNKSHFRGGSISDTILYSTEHVDLVLNLDICRGADLIYKTMGTNNQVDKLAERNGQLPSDVKKVISLLNECALLGIPKCFASGIIMLYLELCEGLKAAA
jgi:hypothetical protein